MFEQTPNASYEQLEAILFALSPEEYEEFFHNFAEETAEIRLKFLQAGSSLIAKAIYMRYQVETILA